MRSQSIDDGVAPNTDLNNISMIVRDSTIQNELPLKGGQERKKNVSFAPVIEPLLLQPNPVKPIETDASTDVFIESARNLATDRTVSDERKQI